MDVFEYEYPEKLMLEDGSEITLSLDDMKNERMIALVIPEEQTWPFASYLHNHGFEDTKLAWDQGQKYSLSKILNNTWEMHIRIFGDGKIYPHIEVRRDFTQHLNQNFTMPVFYEAMKYLEDFTNAWGILHLKTNKWVTGILTKAKFKINPPDSLTKWEPIASFAGGMIAGVLLMVALDQLKKYLAGPPIRVGTGLVQNRSGSVVIKLSDEDASRIGVEAGDIIGFYEQNGSISMRKDARVKAREPHKPK